MEFRTPYKNHVKVVKDFTDSESLTQQSEAEFTTIRAYIDKYTRLGVLGNPARISEAEFGDFASLPRDYGEAVELVQSVNEAFRALPAQVRARYGEDPARFANALSDPAEIAALAAEGLIQSPEPQAEAKGQPAKPGVETSEAGFPQSGMPKEAETAATGSAKTA